MAKKQVANKKQVKKLAAAKKSPAKTVQTKSPAVKVALHVTTQRVKEVKPASKSSSRRAAMSAVNSAVPAVELVQPLSPVVEEPMPSAGSLPVQSDRECQPPMGDSIGDEERRFRAYLKWEAAGRPEGDGSRFWLEAERELLHEQSLRSRP